MFDSVYDDLVEAGVVVEETSKEKDSIAEDMYQESRKRKPFDEIAELVRREDELEAIKVNPQFARMADRIRVEDKYANL